MKHNPTLSDRRALMSEYSELDKVIHDLAKTKFPLYETDSISLRSYMSFVSNDCPFSLYSFQIVF